LVDQRASEEELALLRREFFETIAQRSECVPLAFGEASGQIGLISLEHPLNSPHRFGHRSRHNHQAVVFRVETSPSRLDPLSDSRIEGLACR
jgi:hypothetical protein